MLAWLAKGTQVTLSGRLLVAALFAAGVLGPIGGDLGRGLLVPTQVIWAGRDSAPAGDWDLADPWQRCQAALADAEIPSSVGYCYEPNLGPDLP